jgi:hypothetical protein
MMKSLFLIASLVLLGLLRVDAVYSQSDASITGRITDDTGAVLPGVSVTVANVNTGLSKSTFTNETGLFTVPLLPIGEYAVTAEFPGFQAEVRRGVVLEVGDRARIDFALQVGEVTQFVEVTADAPLVQSETATVGQVVDNDMIVELPLNGRNYVSLALLTPGAMPPAQGTGYGFRGGINIAGNRETSQQYQLDGVDITEAMMSVPVFTPSIDMIAEFKVNQSTYGADLGRRSGGQVTILTKSGTNEFHGSVYEFIRNSSLDARNFFAVDKPPFRWNQFGATLGGPIIKDRTFFFFSWESFRERKGITRTATVPSQAWLNGDFSSLLPGKEIIDPATGDPFPGNIIPSDRFSTTGKAFADWYPAPNLPGTVRNYVNSPTDKLDTDQYSFKVDHRFNDTHSIYVRYTYHDFFHKWAYGFGSGSFSSIAGPGVLGGEPGNLTSEDHEKPANQVVLNLTTLVSPSMVNELKLGFSRIAFYRVGSDRRDIASMIGLAEHLKLRDPRNWGFPGVRVSGFSSLGQSGRPVGRNDNTYQIHDSMTYTRGSHNLKFGADLKRFNNNRLQENSSKGNFSFQNRYTGNSVGDLLLGLPRWTQRLVGSGVQPIWDNSYHFYVQDDWKATPNLTLNIGLRYEFNTPMVSADDRHSTYDPALDAVVLSGMPSHRRDFVRPDLTDPDVMQASQGINFADAGTRRIWAPDRNNFAPRLGLAYRPGGNDRLVLRAGWGIFYDEITGSGGSKGSLTKNYPFTVTQRFNNGTSAPFNLDLPFPAGLGGGTIEVNSIDREIKTPTVQHFNFGIQHELAQDMLVEASYVGSKGSSLQYRRNINQAFLGSGSIASRRPFPPFGNIRTTETTAESDFHSLQLRLERRAATGLTFLSSYTLSKSIDWGSGGGSSGESGEAQDARNVPAERGLSNFDARHRWVLSSVYRLPFGAGQRFLANAGGVANAFVGGWELSGIYTLQSGRPLTPRFSNDYNSTGRSRTSRPDRVSSGILSGSQRTIDRWFDTSAFVIQPQDRFGNSGRGILTGPGINWLDFALMKMFYVGEAVDIQFRTEFFNALNHPNFHTPNIDVNSSRFGRIFSAQDARQIQFALKILF